jgi:hypothetical protein
VSNSIPCRSRDITFVISGSLGFTVTRPHL